MWASRNKSMDEVSCLGVIEDTGEGEGTISCPHDIRWCSSLLCSIHRPTAYCSRWWGNGTGYCTAKRNWGGFELDAADEGIGWVIKEWWKTGAWIHGQQMLIEHSFWLPLRWLSGLIKVYKFFQAPAFIPSLQAHLDKAGKILFLKQ